MGVAQMGAVGVSKSPPPEQAPLHSMRVPPTSERIYSDKTQSHLRARPRHTVTWIGTQSPSWMLEPTPEQAPDMEPVWAPPEVG